MFKNTPETFKQEVDNLFIKKGMHLIGCEFQTHPTIKNLSVDGFVVQTEQLAREASSFMVRGEKGFSRYFQDIYLFVDEDTLVSYGEYMGIFYPKFYHVWKYHLSKEERKSFNLRFGDCNG